MKFNVLVFLLINSHVLCVAQSYSGNNGPTDRISFQSNKLKFFLYCLENKKDGLYIYQQVKGTYKIAGTCNSDICQLALIANPFGKDVIGIGMQTGLIVYSWIDPINYNYDDEKLSMLGFLFVSDESRGIVYRNCQKKFFLRISYEDHHTCCELTYAPSAYYFINCNTSGIDNLKVNAEKAKSIGYCKDIDCPLEPNDPILFDPYYNAFLCVNFDPEQIDFSKEYYNLQIKEYISSINLIDQAAFFDFSSIWLANKGLQDGVLGSNYRRIQFHIDKVEKSDLSPVVYNVVGKSKVGNNICDFKGEIRLTNFFLSDSCERSFNKDCGELFANYTFYEEKTQNHSGVFSGVMECKIYLDRANKKVLIDKSWNFSDSYWNRTFVGTWTDYKTKLSKKCIWGDSELPFTFDFKYGDGDKFVSEKYIKNGWEPLYNSPVSDDATDNKKQSESKWW